MAALTDTCAQGHNDYVLKSSPPSVQELSISANRKGGGEWGQTLTHVTLWHWEGV